MRNILAAVVVVSGCAGFDAQPSDRNFVEMTNGVRDRMHRRFAATVSAREAIERGDVSGARASAHTITQLAEPNVLPEWQPFVAAVRTAAGQVAVASDPASAAEVIRAEVYRESRSRMTIPTSMEATNNTAVVPPDAAATMAGPGHSPPRPHPIPKSAEPPTRCRSRS